MEVGRPAAGIGGNMPPLALAVHMLQTRVAQGGAVGACSGEDCTAAFVGPHASDGAGSPDFSANGASGSGETIQGSPGKAKRPRQRRGGTRPLRPAKQRHAAQPPSGSGPPSTSSLQYTASSDPPGGEDLESTHQQAPVRVMTVKLALTPATIAALGILGFMAIFGCMHLYALSKRHRCACKLCTGSFEVMYSLSEGGFGDVLVVRRVDDGAEFVLKKIRVASVNEASDAQQEAKQLRGFRHPNIVRYADDWLHTERGDGGAAPVLSRPKLFVCIVMERCATDFRQLIDDAAEAGDPLDERAVCDYFAQMCGALRYCHVRNLAHRDIKPQNIFLAWDGAVRVGDFGLSRHLRGGVDTYSDEAGTDYYKAPEQLIGGTIDSRRADVFSLGLVLYELLSLRAVFDRQGLFGAQALRDMRAVDALVADVPKGRYSARLVSMMRRMLHTDAARRPTMDGVLRKQALRSAVRGIGRHTRGPRRPSDASASSVQVA